MPSNAYLDALERVRDAAYTALCTPTRYQAGFNQREHAEAELRAAIAEADAIKDAEDEGRCQHAA